MAAHKAEQPKRATSPQRERQGPRPAGPLVPETQPPNASRSVRRPRDSSLALLADSRLHPPQRHILARELARLHGNRGFQRALRRGIRPSTALLPAAVRADGPRGTVQLAPDKPRWGGRPGSQWAPVPWTEDELNRLKAAEMADAKDDEDRELVRLKYFRGEQVLRNWNNRYGKWDTEGLSDPWAAWFKDMMSSGRHFRWNPKTLWVSFLRRRGEQAGLLSREVAINPFWPEKNKVRYELYKDELESRDPTSIEFNPDYAKYVNRAKPHDLVEPPADAQKFLKDSPYADPIVSNAKLRAEIARLRQVLKLD